MTDINDTQRWKRTYLYTLVATILGNGGMECANCRFLVKNQLARNLNEEGFGGGYYVLVPIAGERRSWVVENFGGSMNVLKDSSDLRQWIHHSTICRGDSGSTSIRLKPNPAPPRTAFEV